MSRDEFTLEMRSVGIGRKSRTIAFIESLRVPPASVTALVGRSGVGKTTLLSTIAGTLPPASGEVRIDGVVRSEAERMTLTARTLQNFPLLHWRTVLENLVLSATIRGQSCPDPMAILRRFRAEHLANRSPKTLSGGERCRASLAQAVVTNPRVLLLDEPLTGLDTVVKEEVATALFEFARAEDAAVVFVTHDLEDACHYADRLVALTGPSPAALSPAMDAKSKDAVGRTLRLLQAGGPS